MSQFHYGMIQMHTDRAIREAHFYSSLNSTMVWFKFRWIRWRMFNRVLVSIPLWYDSNQRKVLYKGGSEWSLNSTMVWFKWRNGIRWGSRCGMSQFHYGMIQIRWGSRCGILWRRLNSTMVWFKSSDKECSTGFYATSQFHYGMIQIINPLLIERTGEVSLNSTMVWFKYDTRL